MQVTVPNVILDSTKDENSTVAAMPDESLADTPDVV
jgi:hypothetical protein